MNEYLNRFGTSTDLPPALAFAIMNAQNAGMSDDDINSTLSQASKNFDQTWNKAVSLYIDGLNKQLNADTQNLNASLKNGNEEKAIKGDYDVGSPNKITGNYAFVKTGNGWTGVVSGLGVAARNSKTNQLLDVELTPLLLTIRPIGPNTQQGASDAFVNAWNTMTDRVEDWLDTRGDGPVSNQQLQNQVMSILNNELFNNTIYYSFSTGPALGNIPTTQANYSWWNSLFR